MVVRRLVVLALAACALTGPGARAAPGVATIDGHALVTPWLPCSAPCQVRLDFTLTLADAGRVRTAVCTSTAWSTYTGGATFAGDEGSGSVTCSGDHTASGTLTYDRTSAVADIRLWVTVDEAPRLVWFRAAPWVFYPSNVAPLRSTVGRFVGAGQW